MYFSFKKLLVFIICLGNKNNTRVCSLLCDLHDYCYRYFHSWQKKYYLGMILLVIYNDIFFNLPFFLKVYMACKYIALYIFLPLSNIVNKRLEKFIRFFYCVIGYVYNNFCRSWNSRIYGVDWNQEWRYFNNKN